jgi:hypothetical protein
LYNDLNGMRLLRVSIEQILAILGAALCLAVTFMMWRAISVHQSMWPAPGLYFIEVSVVSVASASLSLRGSAPSRAAVWVSAGIVLAFSLLGAFSVGLYYFPVAVLFIFAGFAADIRAGQRLLGHVGLFLAAGIVQAAVILAAAYLLSV